MSSGITVRDIDPGDKSWLKREARDVGVSMEEFVRRLIHEKRTKTERRPKPSEAFARHFTGSNCLPGHAGGTDRRRSSPSGANDRPGRVADRHECRIRDDAAAAGAAGSRFPGFDR